MTWFRVDDQLADHPKVMALGEDRLAALGLWTMCGTYCAKHLTDGFVPQAVAAMYAGRRSKLLDGLVKVCLLERVAGGYRMHDYHDYNPSRQKVQQDRSKKQAAGRAGGQASAQARAEHDGSEAIEPRPVPSRPTPVDTYEYVDPAALYVEKVGRRPGKKELDWLEDLHVRYSRSELVAAMQSTPKGPDFLKRLDAFIEGRAA